MGGKKTINENYIHNCDSKKYELKNSACSITKMGFNEEQVMELLDFYLFNAPVLKDEKKADLFGLKSLKNYGWFGGSDLSKLEGVLLKTSGIGMFCIIKADSIEETLKSMDLFEKVCIEHPRAVIKQNCSVSIKEDGSTSICQKETRMECLFRHLRNSFAHNHTYMFENGNIMLEDSDESGKITGRVIMPKQALIEWMNIITKRTPR